MDVQFSKLLKRQSFPHCVVLVTVSKISFDELVYFWTLNSVPLACFFFFLLESYSFDFYTYLI